VQDKLIFSKSASSVKKICKPLKGIGVRTGCRLRPESGKTNFLWQSLNFSGSSLH